MAQIHLPTSLEILIEPGPKDLPYHGAATLRAGMWKTFPTSEVNLKILPTKGDVHFDPEKGTFRIEITLSALVEKPPLDPPLVILP
jgi:hypothetical protein